MIRKFLSPLLFLTFVLGACSLPAETITVISSVTDTPTPPLFYEECIYQWGYQELPDLTAQFDRAVKNLIPASVSRATAFGEYCIGADGQVIRFLAMETDFYVSVKVETLDDYDTFGNWIADVMQVVSGLPPDMLASPNSGFVEFRFEKDAMESIALRVPIREYRETAAGLTGEELFKQFYKEP